MSGRREALVVAACDYEDPSLRRLRAPGHDADALARVLGDRSIGGFRVRQLRNEPAHVVSEALEEFFAGRDRDDLLLVYFSGHGLKDEDGALHLAAANTKMHRLAATTVPATFIDQQMTRSRSRGIVLILDCCYAGAFARGLVPRAAAADLGIDRQFGGSGRAVITSSSAVEYSFEGSEARPSVFTSVLVHGLSTGAADRDGDGVVTLDEIYDYVYAGVRKITPHQTPGKWMFDVQGSLHIARQATGAAAPHERRPARHPRRWSAAALAAGLVLGGAYLARDRLPTGGSEAEPTPTITPVAVFRDDFTTNKGGWPTSSPAATHGGYYQPGLYRFGVRKHSETWWSSPKKAAEVYPQAPSNIRVSAQARWSSPDDGAWFGLACRVSGDNDAYLFFVRTGLAHIVKMKDGNYLPPLAETTLRGADLNAGVHLDADCATTNDAHATRLTLRVDGRLVAEHTDTASPLETGTVGVAVEMSDTAYDAEAEFHDFAVDRL